MEDLIATVQPTNKHSFWEHFSKKTLGLVLALALITAGLVYIAIRQEQPAKTSAPIPTPKVSHAYSILSLVLESASNAAYQTIAIHVDSKQNRLSGAQINLAYDPAALTNMSLKVGDYFANPTILLKNVDAKNGRITLVLAIQPNAHEASGSGTIATLSYSVLPSTSSTKIQFLPKTALTQEGELETVLKSAEDYTITIPTPTKGVSVQTTPVPTVTP